MTNTDLKHFIQPGDIIQLVIPNRLTNFIGVLKAITASLICIEPLSTTQAEFLQKELNISDGLITFPILNKLDIITDIIIIKKSEKTNRTIKETNSSGIQKNRPNRKAARTRK